MATPNPPPKTPLLKLLIAWVWVGAPLAWGVSQTLIKAMGLFR
jgi:hypothetical protein